MVLYGFPWFRDPELGRLYDIDPGYVPCSINVPAPTRHATLQDALPDLSLEDALWLAAFDPIIAVRGSGVYAVISRSVEADELEGMDISYPVYLKESYGGISRGVAEMHASKHYGLELHRNWLGNLNVMHEGESLEPALETGSGLRILGRFETLNL